MKIAIIYTTKGGTTKECATLLKKSLNTHTVELFEIGKSLPEFDDYDSIVVGFPIRMGKAAKKARVFLKENSEKLKKARAAYFICCGFIDCFDEYAQKCIPSDLKETAVAVYCLGGSLDPVRFKGFDRLVVKAVRAEILGGGDNGDQRKDMELPTILESNITQFADKIKGAN